MALVKTSKIAGSEAKSRRSAKATSSSNPQPAPSPARARIAGNGVGTEKISERVAAATEELATGLSQASAAAEELAPVALLALLKHPLVGGEAEDRIAWLDAVRELDLVLRGPRPPAGLTGLDEKFAGLSEWQKVRPKVAAICDLLKGPVSLAALSSAVSNAAQLLAGDAVWRGPDGRMAAEMLAWSGVGLIAFVPLVGLAVFPLQLAALLLRGLAFAYLGLTTLGAYLTLYQAYTSRRREAIGHARTDHGPGGGVVGVTGAI